MATLCSRVANMTARCLYQVGEVIRQPLLSTHTSQVTSVRTRYADWRMLRDVKRRRLVKEMGRERRNINLIRKNDILPTELQEEAHREVIAMPRDSNYVRIRHRCAITSRARSVQHRWRVSRIVWRQLADANHMAGVTRAWW
ncbi:28S ribosomal protein S14, mitochondrial-like isoform X2 [Anneissia japonica]|uniref:28S ribosomal protein S14, mitochondrial-like isoform X2 n=1 Tax=Anneissia japonica TaxID=1529436 RepID=UPI0014255F4E|nr:28S ribosomal protein S14, mitochondrial-like isoform X2 [Anneissia japonica]